MTATIDTNILLHLLRESYLVPTIQEKFVELEVEDTSSFQLSVLEKLNL